jgi:hypothetical protein
VRVAELVQLSAAGSQGCRRRRWAAVVPRVLRITMCGSGASPMRVELPRRLGQYDSAALGYSALETAWSCWLPSCGRSKLG